MLISFVVSTALNGLLLGQYIYYNFIKNAKPAAAKHAAPVPAAAPAGGDDSESESPASGSAPSSTGPRRRRARRD